MSVDVEEDAHSIGMRVKGNIYSHTEMSIESRWDLYTGGIYLHQNVHRRVGTMAI